MLMILTSLAVLAAAASEPAAPPKPGSAPAKTSVAPAKKPNENCVVVKKRMILGHEVTHVKCEDPKPAPKPAA